MPKKNPKPLTIVVTDHALYHTPELQALQAKGHILVLLGMADVMLPSVDVIVGPLCWNLTHSTTLASHVKLMESGVRRRKYPAKRGETGIIEVPPPSGGSHEPQSSRDS